MARYTMLKGHETAQKSFLFVAKRGHVGIGFTAQEEGHGEIISMS